MACNSCKKVIEFGRSGLEYTRSNQELTDRYGKSIPRTGSVVKTIHSPTGGWGVAFFVKEIRVTFDGSDPNTIFKKVSENFQLNDVSFTVENLWFNLNLQWLQRQPKKYRRVSYEDFLALANSSDFTDPADNHAKSVWHPEDWQETAFSFLALHLATNTYKYDEFIVLVNHLMSMYNPTRSPLTGSSSKYISFMSTVKKLKDNPQYEITGARQWLYFAYTVIVDSKKEENAYFTENHWL